MLFTIKPRLFGVMGCEAVHFGRWVTKDLEKRTKTFVSAYKTIRRHISEHGDLHTCVKTSNVTFPQSS
jgi:hypothetical protein